ncbi:hypothetical protein SAMN05518683_11757 [Salibacterium halotolerans]|uniref:N-acetyltransferase domain-containing protein n=2 Tax=Salibacterium halotolerans TaxID=1884432 RepID=A0A1I5VUF5_9BACI|nr:hypothetical protein SAMN05518683_11757 [Salibacterium halotolerans]
MGELALLDALDRCMFISDYIGFNFIVLEALDQAVGFFGKYGFRRVKRHNELLVMAMKVKDLKDS